MTANITVIIITKLFQIARPSHKKPPDSLILERRKKDEQRLKVQEEVLQQKHQDLKVLSEVLLSKLELNIVTVETTVFGAFVLINHI